MQAEANYEKLIYKISHLFKHSILPMDHSLSFEDLVQEGWSCYLELLEEQRDKELNWPFEVALFNKIEQRFIDIIRYLKRKKRHAEVMSLWEFKDPEKLSQRFNVPVGQMEFVNYLPEALIQDSPKYFFLSEEAKEVVYILKNSPKELIEVAKEFGLDSSSLAKTISKYLFVYKGWEIPKIQKFWDSL